MRIDIRLTRVELESLCSSVISHNAGLLPADHDLGLIVFVTAGQNPTYLGLGEIKRIRTPTVCIHTFPLPFELWANLYETGLHLVTTTVQCLTDRVLEPRIKHRSRLHWYMADLEAKQIDPTAMAILFDEDGYLTETATGNLCVVQGSSIWTPKNNVLNGISRDVVQELAESIGLTFGRSNVSPDGLSRSSEAFLASTPHCLLPVTRFNNRPIGTGEPGPIYRKLIAAWSDLVGVNIIQQMQEGARSRENSRDLGRGLS